MTTPKQDSEPKNEDANYEFSREYRMYLARKTMLALWETTFGVDEKPAQESQPEQSEREAMTRQFAESWPILRGGR